jgi:hypothetical protein
MNTEDRKRLMLLSESELRAALIEAQEDAEINLKAAERNFDALKRVEAENARLREALLAQQDWYERTLKSMAARLLAGKP